MKLKKRQFARLKDIAEEVNTCGAFGLAGIKLDKLITDIESVQKVKPPHEFETVQENPVPSSSIYSFAAGNIFNEQRKAVDDYIRKQGESMVAASTDKSTEFKGGLRDAVEALADPKIGDVGYFWGDDCFHALYGKIVAILPGIGHIYGILCNGTELLYYSNFSKTPPELK